MIECFIQQENIGEVGKLAAYRSRGAMAPRHANANMFSAW